MGSSPAAHGDTLHGASWASGSIPSGGSTSSTHRSINRTPASFSQTTSPSQSHGHNAKLYMELGPRGGQPPNPNLRWMARHQPSGKPFHPSQQPGRQSGRRPQQGERRSSQGAQSTQISRGNPLPMALGQWHHPPFISPNFTPPIAGTASSISSRGVRDNKNMGQGPQVGFSRGPPSGHPIMPLPVPMPPPQPFPNYQHPAFGMGKPPLHPAMAPMMGWSGPHTAPAHSARPRGSTTEYTSDPETENEVEEQQGLDESEEKESIPDPSAENEDPYQLHPQTHQPPQTLMHPPPHPTYGMIYGGPPNPNAQPPQGPRWPYPPPYIMMTPNTGYQIPPPHHTLVQPHLVGHVPTQPRPLNSGTAPQLSAGPYPSVPRYGRGEYHGRHGVGSVPVHSRVSGQERAPHGRMITSDYHKMHWGQVTDQPQTSPPPSRQISDSTHAHGSPPSGQSSQEHQSQGRILQEGDRVSPSIHRPISQIPPTGPWPTHKSSSPGKADSPSVHLDNIDGEKMVRGIRNLTFEDRGRKPGLLEGSTKIQKSIEKEATEAKSLQWSIPFSTPISLSEQKRLLEQQFENLHSIPDFPIASACDKNTNFNSTNQDRSHSKGGQTNPDSNTITGAQPKRKGPQTSQLGFLRSLSSHSRFSHTESSVLSDRVPKADQEDTQVLDRQHSEHRRCPTLGRGLGRARNRERGPLGSTQFSSISLCSPTSGSQPSSNSLDCAIPGPSRNERRGPMPRGHYVAGGRGEFISYFQTTASSTSSIAKEYPQSLQRSQFASSTTVTINTGDVLGKTDTTSQVENDLEREHFEGVQTFRKLDAKLKYKQTMPNSTFIASEVGAENRNSNDGSQQRRGKGHNRKGKVRGRGRSGRWRMVAVQDNATKQPRRH